jgi:type III secretion system chaperone SycN
LPDENTMDLQTQRSLEEFLRLADLAPCRVDTRMEFSLPPFRLYIEHLQGRVLLSLARQIDACRRLSTLITLLRRCQPAYNQGVPLRAYLLNDQQLLSCAPAPGSDVNHWLDCLNVMRRLLMQHPAEQP